MVAKASRDNVGLNRVYVILVQYQSVGKLEFDGTIIGFALVSFAAWLFVSRSNGKLGRAPRAMCQ